MSVIKANQLDINNLKYSSLKKNKFGGQQIYYSYCGKKLKVQTPKMRAPFGVNESDPEKTQGKIKFTLPLSFDGYKEEGDIQTWYNFVNGLDELNVQKALENDTKWFGESLTPLDEEDASVAKKMAMNAVKKAYKPKVSFSKNKETKKIKLNDNGEPYPPTMEAKIVQDSVDGHFIVEVYDANRRGKNTPFFEYDLSKTNIKDVIKPHSEVVCILSLSGMWFIGSSQFGYTWNLEQVLVYKADKLEKCAFAIESPEEDANEESDGDDQSESEYSEASNISD